MNESWIFKLVKVLWTREHSFMEVWPYIYKLHSQIVVKGPTLGQIPPCQLMIATANIFILVEEQYYL